MIKYLWDEFKRLTEYNSQDVANKFKISRQRVHEMKQNYSLLYRTSFAYMLDSMIDDRIKQINYQLEDLNSLKLNLKEYAQKGE